MTKRKFLAAVVLCFISVTYSFSQSSYSFDDGLDAAKSSGKKVFLDIYSSSDNWSKKMEAEVYSSAKVQSALSNFIFVKLDADGTGRYNYGKKDYSAGELAKFFGGTGYPTFVVLNSDGSIIKFKYNGEETSNLSGFIAESDFIEMLNFFAQNKYKDTDLSTIFQN